MTVASDALGRLPSGLSILTIGQADEATGMLVSWVQQAAFNPPMVSIALQAGRPVAERVSSGEPFVLNVVGEGHKAILKHFARGFAPGDDAFDGVTTISTGSGPPALAEAIATIECVVQETVAAGDHRLVVARVIASEVRSETPPMVHLRKRGDHY